MLQHVSRRNHLRCNNRGLDYLRGEMRNGSKVMSEQSMGTANALALASDLPSPPTAVPFLRKILPLIILAIGLVLTGLWMCLLGYGLVELAQSAF